MDIANAKLNIFDNLPPVIRDKAVFICAEKHVKKTQDSREANKHRKKRGNQNGRDHSNKN